MRLRMGLLAVLSLLIAVLAAPAAAAPAPSGTFAHAGRWITDAQGRVIILDGVNMVYKHPPYTQEAAGFDDDDAKFLAANGFDAVRVGVIWKAVEPSPGVYDDNYLASIERTVETLAAHGIVSLLDMHQDMYNERFQGEFAPDWAVIDDGLPAEPRLGFPGNQFVQPALSRAYEHFLANSPGPGGVGVQDRFAAAWAHVASYFRGVPGVLGYDLLNEPWPGAGYPTCVLPGGCTDDPRLTALYRNVTERIRTADPDTMVFYEPFSIFNAGLQPTGLGAIGDPHAGLSFHVYCGFAAIGADGIGCDIVDDRVFSFAEQHSQQTGAALLLTEFGATNDFGYLASVVDRAASHMVGWMYWAYCGCDDPTTQDLAGQALVEDPHQAPEGANVNAAKLVTLAVPHPKAVAGTPVFWHFDRGAKDFEFSYRTARADGAGSFPGGSTTSVALPPVQYPQGYRVEVTGATVASAPNAATLELCSDPGATDVSVRVTPR